VTNIATGKLWEEWRTFSARNTLQWQQDDNDLDQA